MLGNNRRAPAQPSTHTSAAEDGRDAWLKQMGKYDHVAAFATFPVLVYTFIAIRYPLLTGSSLLAVS